MQQNDRLERLRSLSPAKRELLLKKFAQQTKSSVDVPAIKPRREQGPAALSFAQQQLFYLYLLDPANPAYNLPIALQLLGILDISALMESLRTIIQRHEILRTHITFSDGKPVQVVDADFAFVPQIIDARAYTSDALEQAVDAELSTPFDLLRGPLIRVTLFIVEATKHVLLLNMPHVVSDGWSIGIFIKELNSIYTALSQGLPCSPGILPLQYADYAAWQREWLQGAVLENHLNYWRTYLQGSPTILDLPTNHSRPTVQRYRGNTLSFLVPEGLSRALHQLSQAEGVTLFMTLLAAFQVLLYRFSGQADFLVGTPFANRTREETEGLIGCFVNTLVLRSGLAGAEHPSFRTLLQSIRRACLGAYEHQELPFEYLVEALQPERNTSYNPLFQVMFALQNVPEASVNLPGLRVDPVEEKGGSAKFDLTLSMTEQGHDLEGILEYNSDLFEQDTIERLRGYFMTLLQGIVEDAGRDVADLPLLPAEEMRYLVHELNRTSKIERPGLCLHQLVERQVARTPDAVALVCGEERLTYDELDRRANAVAVQLRAHGVGPEVLVGICAERSPWLVIGLLGILKAGGAYVPLDPAYPEERLSFILADTCAPVLLTQRTMHERVATYEGAVLWLDEIVNGEVEEVVDRAPFSGSPANLAYVIYTSGSTGRPKGVAITHASATMLVAWALKTYTAEELHGVLASTSICFDLSIFEMFVPLSIGGTSILVEHALQLKDYTGSMPVTLVNTVPSAARELLRCEGFPPTVSTINLAGEALPLQLAQDLYARTTARRVFNLYGPSEDTTYSTGALVPRTIADAPGIGRPIEHTHIYLLDQRLALVPLGRPGEIYIGGAGLARGYLNRPDLTAERFVPDPFSGEPGARLYKTGDLARYQADGSLTFLGRIDHQVKVRGFRVELGEIETVLARHTGLRGCVVLAQRDEHDVSLLVAYGIPQPGQELSSDDLRQYLQKLLPGYMIPSIFILLDAFPLTPNGKVDRQALSAFYQRSNVSAGGILGPRDTIELRLTQLWEKTLQTSPISVHANFFDLGGHSLLAIQLVEQVQRQFACSLPLSAFVQQGTIEYIAQFIRSGEAPVRPSPLVLLQPDGDDPPFFCIHPAGGSALCYVDLARHLARPFYGLQLDNFSGRKAQPLSLPEMATEYIAAIQSVQPRGPYYLGGWSLGGAIAFEMAQQLVARGQEIASLVLIDSFVPTPTADASSVSQQDMLIGFALHLGLSQEHFDSAPAPLSELSWNEQWAYTVGCMREMRVIPPGSDSEYLQQRFLMYQATIRAWLRYQPREYQGSLSLLRARERAGRNEDDPTLGWRRFVPGHLSITDVPGDHYTLMRQPQVFSLAEQVRHCLEQAPGNVQKQPLQEVFIDGIS